MARYRVVQWRDIPAQVEAFEGEVVIRRSLSPRFQELIDAIAMREGVSDAEAYLEGWAHGPEQERAGGAAAVADAVAAEIEAAFEATWAPRLRPLR